MFGEIEYSVTVEFDRPWRLKLKMMNTFRVVQKTNLTLSEPKMMKYAEFVKSKNSGTIFKDGLFLLKVLFNFKSRVKKFTHYILASLFQTSIPRRGDNPSTCHHGESFNKTNH